MDAIESTEWAASILSRIDEFRRQCEEEQYTDTQAAHELLKESRLEHVEADVHRSHSGSSLGPWSAE